VSLEPREAATLVVQTIAQTAVVREHEYGELDAVVGDGDFGFSLARGFEHLLTVLPDLDELATGPFLTRVGTVMTMKIGGTSGPIWGTAFMRAGAACTPTGDGPLAAIAMLRAAMAGIQERGHAELGDKTLLDALAPAIDELERAIAEGADAVVALNRAAREAERGAERTREMQARRGRAAYAGERSIGSLDPGAVAVAEMLAALHLAWADVPNAGPNKEEQT
jgi:phosphoenolpyruvate---glycerone phosphotransferase subunit DhaL